MTPFDNEISRIEGILRGNFSNQADKRYWEIKLAELKNKAANWSDHEKTMKEKERNFGYSLNNDFNPYRD